MLTALLTGLLLIIIVFCWFPILNILPRFRHADRLQLQRQIRQRVLWRQLQAELPFGAASCGEIFGPRGQQKTMGFRWVLDGVYYFYYGFSMVLVCSNMVFVWFLCVVSGFIWAFDQVLSIMSFLNIMTLPFNIAMLDHFGEPTQKR